VKSAGKPIFYLTKYFNYFKLHTRREFLVILVKPGSLIFACSPGVKQMKWLGQESCWLNTGRKINQLTLKNCASEFGGGHEELR